MKKAFVYFLWAILLIAALFIIIMIIGITLFIYYMGIIAFIKSAWKALAILLGLLIAIKLLFMRRVNNLFVYPMFNHNIGQMPSVLALIQLNFRNNYKSNNPSHCMQKFLHKSSKKARTFFKKTKLKEFITETNEEMAHQLKTLEKKGLLKLVGIEEPKTIINKIRDKISQKDNDNSQSIEKLLLFGLVTTLINCRNKNYWDFINRSESTKYYKIIVLKNEGN